MCGLSGLVVGPPFFDDPSGLWQAGEEVLVEALVAQPAIEALDEAVLGRLAGRDVMPFDAGSSCQARMAFEVNSVPLSLTTMPGVPRISRLIQFARHADAGERGVGDQARHSRLKSSTTVSMRNAGRGQGVGDEVQDQR